MFCNLANHQFMMILLTDQNSFNINKISVLCFVLLIVNISLNPNSHNYDYPDLMLFPERISLATNYLINKKM